MLPLISPDLDLHPTASPRYTLECAPCTIPGCLDHDASSPADEVIAQIGRTKSATSSEVEAWLRHADDRVLLEVLRLKRFRVNALEHVPALLERALKHARASGMLWTPLLDSVTELAPPEENPVLLRWRAILLMDLMRAGDADDIYRLLTFRSPFLLEGIARSAPYLSSDHVWRLCRRGFVDQLTDNLFLSEGAASSLINYVIDKHILLIGKRASWEHLWSMGRYVRQLDRLDRQGFPLPANRISRIANRLPGWKRNLNRSVYDELEELVLRNLRGAMNAMTQKQRTDVVELLLTANEGDRVRALLAF